ncbi:CHC2 zinc finger domain-containing protein [Eubacterium callanderi]|uniref:CHC2 zinc finger domain-containing protein n=1 Tax=Eubacterium callanderi TaxID=53442 RepID=UPI001C106071|nr:CHC2 zinc finger domain-containing protein [Eubacterium callanderi]MBU5306073.1 DNA primase [Eubacterium callanderi]
MTTKEKADLIKASLTMRELLGMYGLAGNSRHNRIPCPIHDGKDRNFSFTDFGFKCFVCGAEGGLVHFVELYRGLSFEAALEEINGHFRLWESISSGDGEPKGPSYTDRLKAAIAADDRKAGARIDKTQLSRLNTLAEEIQRLRQNKEKYAPQNENEAFDDRYVEACTKLNLKEYQFDSLFEEAQEVRKRGNDQ